MKVGPIIILGALAAVSARGALGRYQGPRSPQPAFSVQAYYHGHPFRDVTLPAFAPSHSYYSPGDITSAGRMIRLTYQKGERLSNGADDQTFVAPIGGTTAPVGMEIKVSWTPRGSDCFHVVASLATLKGFEDPSHLNPGEDAAIIEKVTFDKTVTIPLGVRAELLDDADGFGLQIARLAGAATTLSPEEVASANLQCELELSHGAS